MLLEEITTAQLSSALSDRSRLIYETAAGYFSLNLENFDLSRGSNYSPVSISSSIAATFQPNVWQQELLLPGTDIFTQQFTPKVLQRKKKISALFLFKLRRENLFVQRAACEL